MTKEITRLYAGKDVDMITVLSIILGNAKDNQPALQKKRTNITMEFLDGLEKRLDAIIKKYFGADNAKQLRAQTQLVYSLEGAIYKSVSDMKRQISATYSGDKNRLNEVLTQLGYNAYFKEAQKHDVEALINLLYRFQQNMTPELQAELVQEGTPETDIISILSNAGLLHEANVSQELFKSTKKVATADAVQAYNGMYKEVMDKLCKLAPVFFPDSKKQQQLLSYTTLLRSIGSNADKKKPEPVNTVG